MMNPDSSKYAVQVSERLGRHLVATKDINEGETICCEYPLVIGPKQATFPVCLSCYRRVDGGYRCSGCGWPLCDENCECTPDHQPECQLFASQHLAVEIVIDEDCKEYDGITPLRCLLTISQEPDKAVGILSMVDHEAERKNIGIWNIDQLSVVNLIRETWKIQTFSQQEIQRVCGILEVNAFEVGEHDRNARAIYPTMCLMSHDCVPNTACFTGSDNQIIVKAAVPIEAGTVITTSYTFTLDNSEKRRQHLRKTKFFHCACQRCLDPTELGTHLSTLICPHCCEGYLVPEEPCKDDTSWTCLSSCGFKAFSYQVNQIVDCLQNQADSISYDDVQGLESFIENCSGVLHPNNAILIGIKYYLCSLYGTIHGHFLDQTPSLWLQRKIQICQGLLAICAVLEPGSSRLRENLDNQLKEAQTAMSNDDVPQRTCEYESILTSQFMMSN